MRYFAFVRTRPYVAQGAAKLMKVKVGGPRKKMKNVKEDGLHFFFRTSNFDLQQLCSPLSHMDEKEDYMKETLIKQISALQSDMCMHG